MIVMKVLSFWGVGVGGKWPKTTPFPENKICSWQPYRINLGPPKQVLHLVLSTLSISTDIKTSFKHYSFGPITRKILVQDKLNLF